MDQPNEQGQVHHTGISENSALCEFPDLRVGETLTFKMTKQKQIWEKQMVGAKNICNQG